MPGAGEPRVEKLPLVVSQLDPVPTTWPQPPVLALAEHCHA